MQKIVPIWTEQYRNTQNAHASNIYKLLQLTVLLWTTPIHIWCYNFLPDFREPCTTFPKLPSCSPSEAHFNKQTPGLFKVEYHIYSTNFVVLNHLTCVKLCHHFLLGSYLFMCNWQSQYETHEYSLYIYIVVCLLVFLFSIKPGNIFSSLKERTFKYWLC